MGRRVDLAKLSAKLGPEPTIYLPEPHPGQRSVLSGMRKRNFLCAGRRWRKTTLAMAVMVERALGAPATAEFVWAAPTSKQCRRGWAEMQRACGDVVRFNENLMEARFPGGQVVYFLDMEKFDNKRGYTSWGTVVDEASEIRKVAYDQVLRPQLSDTDGWLLCFGTPKGQNWFHTEWTRARQGEMANAAAWQVPTLGAAITERGLVRQPHPLENPDFRFEALTEEYNDLPERVFRQEYLAEFLDDQGGVFRGVMRCVRGDLDADARPPDHARRYAIGVDLAKYEDFTVCVVMDLDARRVVAFDRYNRADWPLQCQRIHDLAKRWNDAIVWLDATGVGDPPYDFLRQAGVRIHPYRITGPGAKATLIDNAVLMVEQERVSLPDIPVLLNELTIFEYRRTAHGTLQMTAPEGAHDDCVIAFALACWPMAHTGAFISGEAWAAVNPTVQARERVSEIGGVRVLRKTF